jgi:hypothetical protein
MGVRLPGMFRVAGTLDHTTLDHGPYSDAASHSRRWLTDLKESIDLFFPSSGPPAPCRKPAGRRPDG